MRMIGIEQNTKIKYGRHLYFITYTSITIQTPLQDAQTYQYTRCYNSGSAAE